MIWRSPFIDDVLNLRVRDSPHCSRRSTWNNIFFQSRERIRLLKIYYSYRTFQRTISRDNMLEKLSDCECMAVSSSISGFENAVLFLLPTALPVKLLTAYQSHLCLICTNLISGGSQFEKSFNFISSKCSGLMNSSSVKEKRRRLSALILVTRVPQYRLET